MRVVSFNVHWLQGGRFEGIDPVRPKAAAIKRLAELLSDLSADVVCLQEIQSPQVAAAVAEACGIGNWLYAAGRMLRPQFGGMTLAADARWRLLDASEPPLERFAIKAMRHEPGFQFCIANIHLRSDRHDTRPRAVRGRAEELDGLLQSDPPADIVAGDFNSPPGAELWPIKDGRGFTDAAEQTGQANAPTTVAGKSTDRIWVRRRLADRILRFRVAAADEIRLSRSEPLSDHLPLMLDLDAT